MRRRDALRVLGTAGLVAATTGLVPPLTLACAKPPSASPEPGVPSSSPSSSSSSSAGPARASRLPSLFLAHGAPPLLDDKGWIGELAAWAKALPRPTAVLMVSAHWEERPVTIGAVKPAPLIYDFYGFPERFYRLKYDSPGAPQVAERVRSLLREAKIPTTEEPERGLDHGGYIPLMCMYPKADVPVLGMSLPSNDAGELFAVGRALAPLRDEGVLVIGSGFITHNMRSFGIPTPTWARDFDGWTADVLARHDWDALVDYKKKAPGFAQSLPTQEHFSPLVVAAGVGCDAATTSFPIAGYWDAIGASSFSRRSVQLSG